MKFAFVVYWLLVCLLAGAFSAPNVTGQSYTTVDYPGASNTGVFGINGSGQVSGTYFDATAKAHAFLQTKGKFSSIDATDAQRTFGFGINDVGHLVGYYVTSEGLTQGFIHKDGKFNTIAYPKAQNTRAFGINGPGHVVGTFSDSSGAAHGFLLKGDKFSAIDYPGATRTEAYGINESDQIVGFYIDSEQTTHGFLYSQGTFSSLSYPEATRTSAYSINGSAKIAGTFVGKNGPHGFVDPTGKVRLSFPGSLSTFAFALNDEGKVVGQYVDLDSVVHGYVFEPDRTQLPQISARLDPDYIVAGTSGFMLDVRGISFAPTSVVHWNGVARPTTFVSSMELTARITSSDTASAGTAVITVVAPGPTGGSSNEVLFPIRAPASR